MSDDATADASDAVNINVKATNETYPVAIALSALVSDLKNKLAEPAGIAADNQRLIFSGRVMKNEETLEKYGIKPGNTVHLVRGAASNTRPAAASSATPAVPTNLASGSGNNPLAGLTGARYAGHVQLPSADIFGPDGGVSSPRPPCARQRVLTPRCRWARRRTPRRSPRRSRTR